MIMHDILNQMRSLWSYLSTRSWFMTAIKYGFGMAFIVVLWQKIDGFSVFADSNSLEFTNEINWWFLILAVFFLPVNWGLESLKWMVANRGRVDFFDALKIVLSGLSVGFLTPANLGDYAGRQLADGKNRWRTSVYFTFISGTAQNLVHLLVGGIALYMTNIVLLGRTWAGLGLLLSAGAFLVMVMVIFHRKALIKLGSRIPIETLSSSTVIKMLLLSVMRYSIYLFQYLLIFLCFAPVLDWSLMLGLIAIVFLIQSGMPLPASLRVLARVELAILIFSYHVDNELLILTSALIIWIMNLVMPSLVGMLLLMKNRRFEVQNAKPPLLDPSSPIGTGSL